MWPVYSLFFPLIWKDRTQGRLMRAFQHVIPRPSYRGGGLGWVITACWAKPCWINFLWEKNRVMWTRSLTHPPRLPIAQVRTNTVLYTKYLHTVRVPDVARFCGGWVTARIYLRNPEAARSMAWVCGRPLAGTAGSNPTGGMDVCLLWVLCVVRYRSLLGADHLSRGVLSNVCVSWVWSWSLDNVQVLAY